MGIRSALVGVVTGPARRAMEGDLREMVESALAARSFARADEVAALRTRVESAPESAELTALRARVDGLEKQLSMALGALQTVTTDLVAARGVADGAAAAARQATQQATSARSTAEAAADGVAGVESQVAKLVENLGAPRHEPVAEASGTPKPKRTRSKAT